MIIISIEKRVVRRERVLYVGDGGVGTIPLVFLQVPVEVQGGRERKREREGGGRKASPMQPAASQQAPPALATHTILASILFIPMAHRNRSFSLQRRLPAYFLCLEFVFACVFSAGRQTAAILQT